MNRRNFIKGLLALPLVGILPEPEKKAWSKGSCHRGRSARRSIGKPYVISGSMPNSKKVDLEVAMTDALTKAVMKLLK